MIDWLDLPDDNYVAILGYETQGTKDLDQLIRSYNQIPKDKIETLSCRIKKLNRIMDLIQNWVPHPKDKRKHLLWIAEIASNKKNYLNELLKIYEGRLHENQTKYHNDFSMLRDPSKTPVILTNHRYYSLKMREYWGDFWMEALDPCHRRLTPFLDQWRSLNIDTPFFLWLETQHIPKYVPRVTYLKGDELEKRKVAVYQGLFWQQDAPLSLDPSKKHLFSIDLNKDLYVAEEKEGISHSSFTCGKPVLGAGILQIVEGKLKSLALESGHYMPSIEIGYQILKIFEEKGVLFPTHLELIFFHDRNKYKADLTSFPSFEQFKAICQPRVYHETASA